MKCCAFYQLELFYYYILKLMRLFSTGSNYLYGGTLVVGYDAGTFIRVLPLEGWKNIDLAAYQISDFQCFDCFLCGYF